jgi:hypothetical protein
MTLRVPSSMEATVHKLGRKYQPLRIYLQSIKSVKHMPQSPLTGQLKNRHLGFGVFIVYSSMVETMYVHCTCTILRGICNRAVKTILKQWQCGRSRPEAEFLK